MISIEKESYGVKRNGVIITVQKWVGRKHPVVAVRFENENRVYKVASFSSVETANWFIEVMEEFFDGIIKEEL